MRCGDGECDQRSDSERCFGYRAWRECLIITHAIPEQQENTYYLCQSEHDGGDNERPHLPLPSCMFTSSLLQSWMNHSDARLDGCRRRSSRKHVGVVARG
jgi:hypothetical protein